MTVRRAQPEDLPELVRLNLQVQDLHLEPEPGFFRSPSEDDVEGFSGEVLDDEQKMLLVACDDGKVVGYLLAEIRDDSTTRSLPSDRSRSGRPAPRSAAGRV